MTDENPLAETYEVLNRLLFDAKRADRKEVSMTEKNLFDTMEHMTKIMAQMSTTIQQQKEEINGLKGAKIVAEVFMAKVAKKLFSKEELDEFASEALLKCTEAAAGRGKAE